MVGQRGRDGWKKRLPVCGRKRTNRKRKSLAGECEERTEG